MAEITPTHMDSYKKAIALLKDGQTVALPTETVYGLGAIATDQEAVEKVFAVKNRPLDLPLSLCVFSQKQAAEISHITPLARRFMGAFWPGPLTLVLPQNAKTNICKTANAGLENIGLRCPDINWWRAFKTLGFTQPLVLTSANTSSRPDPLTAQDVQNDIGEHIPLILDGGPSRHALASTIIAIEGEKAKLLRKGALTPDHFAPLSIEWQS